MINPTASLAGACAGAETATGSAPATNRVAPWLLLLAATGIPLSLLWDFSWESTVGIDLVWSPAHTATYLSVALAGLATLGLVFTTTRSPVGRASGVRLGPFYAPFGVWVALWGAVAFLVAVLFDRWWQSAYGLAAGIWHPPQILKAISFFAVVIGVWCFFLRRQNQAVRVGGPLSPRGTSGERAGERGLKMRPRHSEGAPLPNPLPTPSSWGEGNFPGEFGVSVQIPPSGAWAFAFAGGVVLALITVVTLVSIYPNRQHSAWFYKLACGTYPIVFVALSSAGKLRFSATAASLAYLAILCPMVWLLPLFSAKPQVAPIYNPLDHMMPPPFPLLLIAPALVIDALLGKWRWPEHRFRAWFQAVVAGLAAFIVLLGTQWVLAELLLTQLADNWFFAGGGRHWPFFLKIDPLARQSFWETRQDEMNLANALIAAGLAVCAARLGLWIGGWMKRLQR